MINAAIVMLKEKKEHISSNKIFNILEDIITYLENRDLEEYKTMQQCVGMKDVFRGFVVKDLKESKFPNLMVY